uniref:RRM domain-containing protein n=1 Tax=Salix viminalis TaxID=40686 RepID=A0A6N2N448_SALVM
MQTGEARKINSCDCVNRFSLVEFQRFFLLKWHTSLRIVRILDEPIAFLEYAEESVTLKACAGLNGMKLGGQVITAIQAVPNASSSGSDGNPQFGQISQHAKALLEKPTEVLKLKNVFDSENLSTLSNMEVEEVLEDVRLECARFGSVKSINVVKYAAITASTSKSCEFNDDTVSAEATQSLGCDGINPITRNIRGIY